MLISTVEVTCICFCDILGYGARWVGQLHANFNIASLLALRTLKRDSLKEKRVECSQPTGSTGI